MDPIATAIAIVTTRCDEVSLVIEGRAQYVPHFCRDVVVPLVYNYHFSIVGA